MCANLNYFKNLKKNCHYICKILYRKVFTMCLALVSIQLKLKKVHEEKHRIRDKVYVEMTILYYLADRKSVV